MCCISFILSRSTSEKSLSTSSLLPPMRRLWTLVRTLPNFLCLSLCQMLQSLRYLCELLDLLQDTHVCLVLGTPKLDPEPQMWSHSCSTERKDHLLQPAGSAFCTTALGWFMGTLLARAQFVVQQEWRMSFSTYLLSRWSTPSLLWCMVQDLVSPFVKLTEFLVGPFLQPVKMPLSSSRPICRPSSCTNCSSQFCIVCRLAEGALPHCLVY